MFPLLARDQTQIACIAVPDINDYTKGLHILWLFNEVGF